MRRYEGAGKRAEAERLELQMEAFSEEVESEISVLGIGSGLKVLDAGCGTGAFARRIAPLVAPTPVIGVDSDRVFLQQGRTISKKAGIRNLKLEVGDLNRLRFRDSTFDLVYCRLVLFHLKDKLRVLKELRRVTVPGGRVAVVADAGMLSYPFSPKYWSLFGKIGKVRNRRAGRRKYGEKYGEKLPFDTVALMRKAGIASISVHPITVTAAQSDPVRLTKLVEVSTRMLEVYKEEAVKAHLMSRKEYNAGIREIRRWLSNPSSVQMFLVMLTVGVV